MSRGHLVLTRKVGETILIGDDIEVSVRGVDRGQVRISILAPKEIAIAREELVREPTLRPFGRGRK